MRPLKLRIQAFGSYENEQFLDFETALADAPFLLIHGATGSGKTTIFDAIVFALYGQSSGEIRKDAMLRSSTAPPDRTTEVEYVFALGQRRYRVLRSPFYFRMSRGKMTRRDATGQLFRLPDVGETGEPYWSLETYQTVDRLRCRPVSSGHYPPPGAVSAIFVGRSQGSQRNYAAYFSYGAISAH